MTANTATAFWVVRRVTGRASRTAHYVVNGEPLCGTNVLRASLTDIVEPGMPGRTYCAKCANLSKSNTATKEKTAMKNAAAPTAPAADPKPRTKAARKAAAAETVVPEPTERQQKAMLTGAKTAANRARAAAEAVTVTDDPRTLDRKNHLLEKAATAAAKANAVAAKYGLAEPFTAEAATYTPISLPDKEADEPEAESPTVAAGFDVTIVNRHDGSVDVHRAGCADIAKVVKKERLDEPWTLTVKTRHEAWSEYNADFIAECEQGAENVEHDHERDEDCDHSWGLNWLPCASDVPEAEPAKAEPTKAEPFKAAAPKAKRGATATAAGKKAATPAKPKAAKAATPKPVVTPAARSEAKAQALADKAASLGWTVEISDHGDTGRHVMAVNDEGGHVLEVWFIDGKLDLDKMPTYRSDARPKPVILRNVSAVIKQMDEDESKRPVSAAPARASRARSTDDSPRVTFKWDDGLDDDALLASLQRDLAGKRIHWMAKVTEDSEPEPQEALVMKVTTVKQGKSGASRVIGFFSAEWSDKAKGLVASKERFVGLDRIRKAN